MKYSINAMRKLLLYECSQFSVICPLPVKTWGQVWNWWKLSQEFHTHVQLHIILHRLSLLINYFLDLIHWKNPEIELSPSLENFSTFLIAYLHGFMEGTMETKGLLSVAGKSPVSLIFSHTFTREQLKPENIACPLNCHTRTLGNCREGLVWW